MSDGRWVSDVGRAGGRGDFDVVLVLAVARCAIAREASVHAPSA